MASGFSLFREFAIFISDVYLGNLFCIGIILRFGLSMFEANREKSAGSDYYNGVEFNHELCFHSLYGYLGIVLSSILSYLFMLGFRIIDTWKFFPVKVSLEIIYPILFLIGGAIVFYRVDSIILQIIYITVVVILSYCIQPRSIRQELQMKIKALFN